LSLLKSTTRKAADVSIHQNRTTRHEATPFRQTLETLEKSVSAAQVLVVSTMPRGSLQITQPARLPEPLLKSYSKEFHLEDRLSWQAILSGQLVTSDDVLGADHPFVKEFLKRNGLAHAVAAPLAAPVLEGYPGALHVYRTAEQGPFSAEELRRIRAAAAEVDRAIEELRQARRGGSEEPNVWLTPRPQARLFAFDENGKQLLSPDQFKQLDQRLQNVMAEQARVRLNKLNGQLVTADRVQIADSRGDLWTFRAVTYSRYPAAAKDGPIVLFCMQPSCGEWALVRPADLQADAELARLIPSLKFMRQEFHRGPTLGEISRQVALSPFHFHRRFAELLGLTPKHYLLECQITAAKEQLRARKKALPQIATDCGFAHQSHFTSRFKQATGLTPTRWRKVALESQ
jgi:AraC-like DNA-binding protein